MFDLLAHHGLAHCVMSGAGLPCILRVTAPFVYVRLHGLDNTIYTRAPTAMTTCGGGPSGFVSGWGKGVFAYFNNDGYGHAVRNARTLRELLDG